VTSPVSLVTALSLCGVVGRLRQLVASLTGSACDVSDKSLRRRGIGRCRPDEITVAVVTLDDDDGDGDDGRSLQLELSRPLPATCR